MSSILFETISREKCLDNLDKQGLEELCKILEIDTSQFDIYSLKEYIYQFFRNIIGNFNLLEENTKQNLDKIVIIFLIYNTDDTIRRESKFQTIEEEKREFLMTGQVPLPEKETAYELKTELDKISFPKGNKKYIGNKSTLENVKVINDINELAKTRDNRDTDFFTIDKFDLRDFTEETEEKRNKSHYEFLAKILGINSKSNKSELKEKLYRLFRERKIRKPFSEA